MIVLGAGKNRTSIHAKCAAISQSSRRPSGEPMLISRSRRRAASRCASPMSATSAAGGGVDAAAAVRFASVRTAESCALISALPPSGSPLLGGSDSLAGLDRLHGARDHLRRAGHDALDQR